MTEPTAAADFIDKWRARWPEWGVAEVFLPAEQRVLALAWLALQQELSDAAWGGEDARPGEAKLAWWQDELQGWSEGRRRHPLGEILMGALQSCSPWAALAMAVPGLRDSRQRPRDAAEAVAVLVPYAIAVAAIEADLFDVPEATASSGDVASALLASRLLWHPTDATPLQILAQTDDLAQTAPATVRAAWATALQSSWPATTTVTRMRRLQAVLLSARLRQLAGGTSSPEPLSRWKTLWQAWRAARQT